jgi:hypothetical protein
MPVSRKHRSMKKSSKRSNNARTSKKTRKHMRKMRGGGVSDLEQVVDFIIYSGNNVLVSANSSVADPPKNLALIGTFATASVCKNGDVKINHSQKESIETAIQNKQTNDKEGLVPLENLNAFLLLEKSLEDKMSITPIRKYLCTFKPVDGEKFRPVNNDKRLTSDCNAKKGNGCAIFTQLFSVQVDDTEEARNLFTMIPSKDGKLLQWINLDMQADVDQIFSGHLTLLKESGINFKMGGFGF